MPLQNAWFCFGILIPLLLLSAGAHLVIDPPEVIYYTDSLQISPTLPQMDAQFSCYEVAPNSTVLFRPRKDVFWTKNRSATGLCVRKLNSTDRGSATLWTSPYIVYAPTTQLLQPSGAQIVQCSVSSGIRCVRWTKDGQLVATSNATALLTAFDSRYSILSNGSLLILGVKATDAGLYKCMVYNKAGNSSATIELIPEGNDPFMENTTLTNASLTGTPTVMDREHCVSITDYRFGQGPVISTELYLFSKSSTSVPPIILTTSPSCVQSVEGYSIILNCTLSGSPSPMTRWEKDSVSIATTTTPRASDEAHFRQLGDGSLLINTLQTTDRGNYTCHTSSGAMSRAKTTALIVQSVGDICGFSGSSTTGVSGRFSSMHNPAGVRKKRIYGGHEVLTPNQWPWQVILEYPSFQGTVESICGGALIRPDLVLTAAHCVQNLKSCDVVIRAGVFNRSAHEDTQQTLTVKAIYNHYLFSSYSTVPQSADIALLKLTIPAQMTSSVGLVCLPSDGQDPPEQTMCTVSGWGHLTKDSTVSPDLLREAVVPLVSDSQCKKAYKRVFPTWLCAGYPNGTQDACQNDSGGPLVCRQGTRWTEYGIVIAGDGCGEAKKYGIYTRVTKFIDWIASKF
ncbi:hypothetical protein EMCRGX_G034434 [Ephydatia muelleri]